MKSILIWIGLMSCLHLVAQEAVETLIESGYDKYLEEDYEGAVLDFKKALTYDSTNAEVHYLLGVCRSVQGEKNRP